MFGSARPIFLKVNPDRVFANTSFPRRGASCGQLCLNRPSFLYCSLVNCRSLKNKRESNDAAHLPVHIIHIQQTFKHSNRRAVNPMRMFLSRSGTVCHSACSGEAALRRQPWRKQRLFHHTKNLAALHYKWAVLLPPLHLPHLCITSSKIEN